MTKKNRLIIFFLSFFSMALNAMFFPRKNVAQLILLHEIKIAFKENRINSRIMLNGAYDYLLFHVASNDTYNDLLPTLCNDKVNFNITSSEYRYSVLHRVNRRKATKNLATLLQYLKTNRPGQLMDLLYHQTNYYGYTPLHIAVLVQSIECVQLLIKYGSFIDMPDKYGKTPLYHAVEDRRELICLFLCTQGADINASFKKWMGSPLELAKKMGNKNIEAILSGTISFLACKILKKDQTNFLSGLSRELIELIGNYLIEREWPQFKVL